MADDDRPGALAREMARYPDLYRSLLADHRPDRYGRCIACRSGGSLAPRHPCSLATVAEAARRIAEGDDHLDP